MLRLALLVAALLSAAVSGAKAPTKTTIPSDYSLAGGLLGLSALSAALLQPAVAVPTAALGAFLAVQTGKIKFTFDEEAMEIFVVRKGRDESRENFVVGGKNRWRYSAFTKWGFLPSKEFPVLMYFLETQTKPEGQFHLFPVIINGAALYDSLVDKVGLKLYK